jgi:hypothetical protein
MATRAPRPPAILAGLALVSGALTLGVLGYGRLARQQTDDQPPNQEQAGQASVLQVDLDRPVPPPGGRPAASHRPDSESQEVKCVLIRHSELEIAKDYAEVREFYEKHGYLPGTPITEKQLKNPLIAENYTFSAVIENVTGRPIESLGRYEEGSEPLPVHSFGQLCGPILNEDPRHPLCASGGLRHEYPPEPFDLPIFDVGRQRVRLAPGERVSYRFRPFNGANGGAPFAPGRYLVRARYTYYAFPGAARVEVRSDPVALDLTQEHIDEWREWLAK